MHISTILNELTETLEGRMPIERFARSIGEYSRNVVRNALQPDKHQLVALTSALTCLMAGLAERAPVSVRIELVLAVCRIYRAGRRKEMKPLVPDLVRQFRHLTASGHSEVDRIAAVYDSVFAFTWQQLDNFRDTPRFIAQNLVAPFSAYLAKNGEVGSTMPLRCWGRRIGIAYLAFNLSTSGTYANGRTLVTLLKGHARLRRDDIEIFVYVYGSFESATVETVRQELGIKVRLFCGRTCVETLQRELREAVTADHIDVVIAEMYLSTTVRLLSRRLSPIQLYLSMGFAPLIVPGVDHFLISRGAWQESMVREVLHRPATAISPPADKDWLCQPRADELIAATRAEFPAGSIVFGTLCRMEKVSSEFFAAVESVLAAVDNAVMCLCGPNDQGRIEELRAASPFGERFFLYGPVDSQCFLKAFDVYLETFPFGQGMAVLESLANGVPVVKLKSPGMESFEQHLRVRALVAEDVPAFIATAVELARDPELRSKAGQASLQLVQRLTHESNASVEIETLAKRLISERIA